MSSRPFLVATIRADQPFYENTQNGAVDTKIESLPTQFINFDLHFLTGVMKCQAP